MTPSGLVASRSPQASPSPPRFCGVGESLAAHKRERLVGASRGPPSWRESAVAALQGLEGAHAPRTKFDYGEVVAFIKANWDALCWPHDTSERWNCEELPSVMGDKNVFGCEEDNSGKKLFWRLQERQSAEILEKRVSNVCKDNSLAGDGAGSRIETPVLEERAEDERRGATMFQRIKSLFVASPACASGEGAEMLSEPDGGNENIDLESSSLPSTDLMTEVARTTVVEGPVEGLRVTASVTCDEPARNVSTSIESVEEPEDLTGTLLATPKRSRAKASVSLNGGADAVAANPEEIGDVEASQQKTGETDGAKGPASEFPETAVPSSNGEMRASAKCPNLVLSQQDGTKPRWIDSAVAVWQGLAKMRVGQEYLTLSDLCAFADAHWDTICWPHLRHSRWKSMLRRVMVHGHNEKKIFKCSHGAHNEETFCLKSNQTESVGLVFAPQTRMGPVEKKRAPMQKRVGEKLDKKLKKKVEKKKIGKKIEKTSVKNKRGSLAKRRNEKPVERESSSLSSCSSDSSDVDNLYNVEDDVALEKYAPEPHVPQKWTEPPAGPVSLSTFDRGPDITVPTGENEAFAVRGFMGFRSVRATHGVMEGDWYFQVRVLNFKQPGNVRVGWSTRRNEISTPVGFSSHGYGIRDKTGELFHNAQLYPYGESFACGDTIGCRLKLPSGLSNKVKNKVAAANMKWLEHKHDCASILFPLDCDVKLPGAFVEFFKNGKSMGVPSEIGRRGKCGLLRAGTYFPTISIFKNGSARAEFGPFHDVVLPEGCRPFCEASSSSSVGGFRDPVVSKAD